MPKMPRLKELYLNEVAPALMKKFNYKSVMQIPKLDKVVINVGCGEARDNPKVLDHVVSDIAQITGQKPVVVKAKKSVANFKIRAGMPNGVKVTLRGDRMYEFLDRLFNLALPRVRDFRGINPNSFDGRGNYALGVKEQLIFPEIDYDKIDKVRGMDIAIVTTAKLMKRPVSFWLLWAHRLQDKGGFKWQTSDNQVSETGEVFNQAAQQIRFGKTHAYLRKWCLSYMLQGTCP